MANILMIALDDVSAWATLKRTYAGEVHTPNLDRLAASGVNFTEAHTPAPLCGPARAAVLSGLSPAQSGVLTNLQDMFATIPIRDTLPGLLRAEGYETAIAGKVFHGASRAELRPAHTHIISVTDAVGVEYGSTDIERLSGSRASGIWTGDPDDLTDAVTVAKVEEFLQGYRPAAGSKGLLLNVGLTNGHAPWVVPQEFYDLYPLDEIAVPSTPTGDLDDLSAFALQFTDIGSIEALRASGELKIRVQAYLAAVSYVDAMVGRLLDALEASSIGQDTMVVLWSDHGFHLGDKESLAKGTLWAQATRAPLIIAHPDGSRAGAVEDRVISTGDVFATVLDYAGVRVPAWSDTNSLLPLIRNNDDSGLPDTVITMIQGSYSARTEQYRFTIYEDGTKELYDVLRDPNEEVNLAASPALTGVVRGFEAHVEAWLTRSGVVQNRSTTAEVLRGDATINMLVAGFGADTLIGGTGDDTYLVRDTRQVVVEQAGGGHDTILLGGAGNLFRLPDHVEGLHVELLNAGLRDPATRWLFGNALNNLIVSLESTALVVEAGAGNDTVQASNRGSTLWGRAGDDQLLGSTQGDTLYGGDGQDYVSGFIGNDVLSGGRGNDRLVGGDGNDTILAESGQDTIDDAAGTDAVDISAWGRTATRIVSTRQDGVLTSFVLEHTASDSRISITIAGGRIPVEVLIDAGRRELLRSGSDRGTAGADTLLGSFYDDTLDGGDGHDSLDGREGMDLLRPGAGSDTIRGNAGADTIDLGTAQNDVAAGGDGDDVIIVRSGSARITGGTGFDTLRLGGDGRGLLIDDIERIELAAAGIIDAGLLVTGDVVGISGTGRALLQVSGASVVDLGRIALSGVTLQADAAASSVLLGASSILARGGGGADLLAAAGEAQTLDGEAGADTLRGGDGDDLLLGGTDADRMDGGTGADTLQLDIMSGDIALGGAGADLFLARGGTGSADGGAGLDTLRGHGDFRGIAIAMIEAVVLTGSTQLSDAFWRAPGLQSVSGSGAASVSVAGRVDLRTIELATVTLTGGDGRDVITAGGTGVVLSGERGDDSLAGLASAETLIGGTGRDALRGGGGDDLLLARRDGLDDRQADRFLFALGDGDDTIMGFGAVGGERDRIDLHILGRTGATMRAPEAIAAGLLVLEATAEGTLLSYRAALGAAFEDHVLVAGVTPGQLVATVHLFGS